MAMEVLGVRRMKRPLVAAVALSMALVVAPLAGVEAAQAADPADPGTATIDKSEQQHGDTDSSTTAADAESQQEVSTEGNSGIISEEAGGTGSDTTAAPDSNADAAAAGSASESTGATGSTGESAAEATEGESAAEASGGESATEATEGDITAQASEAETDSSGSDQSDMDSDAGSSDQSGTESGTDSLEANDESSGGPGANADSDAEASPSATDTEDDPHADGEDQAQTQAAPSTALTAKPKAAAAALPTTEDGVTYDEAAGDEIVHLASSPAGEFCLKKSGECTTINQKDLADLGNPPVKKSRLGFYRLPWPSATWQVYVNGGRSETTARTLERWGHPTVAVVPTTFMRTPWDSTKYAVINWTTKAGTQVIVSSNARWKKAKSPKVQQSYHVPKSRYWRWETSPKKEVFVTTPNKREHKMTATEYRRSGSHTVRRRQGGFVRSTITNRIYRIYDIDDSRWRGYKVTNAAWKRYNKPTIRTRTRIPGDRFQREWGTRKTTYTVVGYRHSGWTIWNKLGRPKARWTYPDMFSYGTLRPGQAAYGRFMSGSVSKYYTTSISGMRMYLAPSGTFPYAVEYGGATIKGTQLDVKTRGYTSVVARVDRYERYSPKQSAAKQLYVRTIRKTARGDRTWIYLASPRMKSYVMNNMKWIRSGDWLRR